MPFLKVSISFFIQKRENEEKDIVLLQWVLLDAFFLHRPFACWRTISQWFYSARIIPLSSCSGWFALHPEKVLLLMRMLQDHRRSKYLSSLDYANYLTTLILCEIYQQYISQMRSDSKTVKSLSAADPEKVNLHATALLPFCTVIWATIFQA